MKKQRHLSTTRCVLFLLLGTWHGCYGALSYGNHSLLKNQTSLELIEHGIRTIPLDFKKITLYPVSHPYSFLAATLGITGLVAVDKPVTQYIQEHVNPQTNMSITTLWNTPVTQATDGYLLAGVAGLYTGGVVIQNTQTQAAAIVAGKSVAYSYIYGQLILKSLFGRARPNPNLAREIPAPSPYTNNPWDFFHIHGPTFNSSPVNTSMPSFHFTLFFSVASGLQNVYDSYWPYLITLGTIPNFQDHHHWFSDMVAGSLLGIMIGQQVANNYLIEFDNSTSGNTSQFQLSPTMVAGGAGVMLHYMGDW